MGGWTSCQAATQVMRALGIVDSMCKLTAKERWMRVVHAKLLFQRSRSSRRSKPITAKRKASSRTICALALCSEGLRIFDVLGRAAVPKTWWHLGVRADLTLELVARMYSLFGRCCHQWNK